MSADGAPSSKVMKMEKEETGSQYWDFSAQSSLFNFCLNVEERQLWAPRDVLACHSEPLKAMVYGQFREKDLEKADLPGKSYEDVLEWLRCVVPCPKQKPVDGTCKLGEIFSIIHLNLDDTLP